MRGKIVAGNWKMNGSISTVKNLLAELSSQLTSPTNAQCIVFPPAVYLPLTQTLLQGSSILWGAQNVYPKDQGAFTGELSCPMLKEFGCTHILVGHSERRHVLGEDEKIVADKYHQVKEHGMIPILCVGETLKARQEGETHEVLSKQLLAIVNTGERSFSGAVIAYEPVWAIGTGHTATPEQAQEAHSFIREFVSGFNSQDAEDLPLLYGGSVNEKNAGHLFAMPDVDGGLVGGASLNAQQFVEIVKCIN